MRSACTPVLNPSVIMCGSNPGTHLSEKNGQRSSQTVNQAGSSLRGHFPRSIFRGLGWFLSLTFVSESFELELNGTPWDTSGSSFVQNPSEFSVLGGQVSPSIPTPGADHHADHLNLPLQVLSVTPQGSSRLVTRTCRMYSRLQIVRAESPRR